eukprot:209109_1
MSASTKPRRDRKSKHKKKRLKNILSLHIHEKKTSIKLRRTISADCKKRNWKTLLHLRSSSSKLQLPNKKTHWKPSIYEICKNIQLLHVLIEFMERSYNEELILFILSIQDLNRLTTDSGLDRQIDLIFNRFISNAAKFQINLSFECLVNVTQMCQPERVKRYSLDEKRQIFKYAVDEVELLMECSVLPLFYISDEFRTIPQPKVKHIKIESQGLPTIPALTPKKAPIVLEMSHSPSAHVEARNELLVGDATDEMVFVADYFESR